MEFRILGPLEVVERGRALELGGSRQRTLLALLLTRANEVVSADRLIDGLWAARPPRTAANALQYHVSRLRKVLAPAEPIVTREPGYVIRVGPDELDLFRFERLVEQARRSSPDEAAQLLRDALGLWRGPPLADLEHEALGPETLRLEELFLGALESRLEADLVLGRHADLVGELETLVSEHPLRERLRGLLMRALYGAGRQAQALGVYRQARALLVEELGIEPGPELQELERAILRQDAALLVPRDDTAGSRSEPRLRAILVVTRDTDLLGSLLAIAEPLACRPPHELILARLLSEDGDLTGANAALGEQRRALLERGVSSRIAAYTTAEPASEAILLATEHDADLILVDAHPQLFLEGKLDEELGVVLAGSPCDVAVLAGSGELGVGPVVTPFGGAEHDWSAIEIAAWLAGSLGTTLRLLGTEADLARGRRDASRLLSRASLVVQQVAGIVTEPVLVAPGADGVAAAARDARVLVIGLSDRWQSDGIGPVRLEVAARAGVPTLFVRRGLRPGGVAPNETFTRFTWTLAAQGLETPA